MKINLPEVNKRFFACAVADEEFYIATCEGLLLKGKKDSLDMAFIREKEGYELLIENPPEKMILSNNSIFLFAINYKAILEYDLIDHSCILLIDFTKDKFMQRRISKYHAIVQGDECAYIFVDNSQGYYILRSKSCTFEKYSSALSKYNWEAQNVLSIVDFESNDAFFYFIDCGKIIGFSSRRGEFEEYGHIDGINNAVSIDKCDETFYVLSTDGEYYSFQIEDCKVLKHVLPQDIKYNVWDHFCITRRKIFFLPGSNDELMMIDLQEKSSDKMHDIDYPTDMKCLVKNEQKHLYHKFREFCDDRGIRYYAARYYDYVLCIDKTRSIVEWKRIKWPSSELFFAEYISRGQIVPEANCSLCDMIQTISGL